MLHSVLFKDADLMSDNYMFLSGQQADTIRRYKSEILSVYNNLERYERIATGENTNSPLYNNFRLLEGLYFSTLKRYCNLCDNFENWLYKQGYFETVAAYKDTPKNAVLINR